MKAIYQEKQMRRKIRRMARLPQMARLPPRWIGAEYSRNIWQRILESHEYRRIIGMV